MRNQSNGAETIAALIVIGVFTVLVIDTVRDLTIPSDVLILLSNVIVAVTSWYFGVHANVAAVASTQQATTAAVQAATSQPPTAAQPAVDHQAATGPTQE